MKKGRPGRRIAQGILFFLAILLLAYGAYKIGYLLLCSRGHGNVITESFAFTESSRKLNNPNRGFYHMHGFRVNDEDTDFNEEIAKRFAKDKETTLTMIQINLQYYRDMPISDKGLENMEALFEALEQVDKQLIIRFLYDWNGENPSYEPESLDIILEHMRQVGPLLCKYKDRIYTMQGLFIGNWGEMNGTKYANAEDIQALAEQLAKVTDKSTFLSVRMPMHWRIATQLKDENKPLASRLGVYNDGMLGSYSDYGTYGNHNKKEHGYFTYWNREEELEFQDSLGKSVPIGGEVIVDNPYNDFENAIRDLAQMHVTYINRDYDSAVLDKWEETVISEDGCFKGMDGLSYIERHLGYRLLIRDTKLTYQFKEDKLSVDVILQNIGFAPVYKETDIQVILCDEERAVYHVYDVEQDIGNLTGGNQSDLLQTIHVEIPLTGETEKKYEVYFRMIDNVTGEQILLANEEEPERYGYKIGTAKLESVDKLIEDWVEGLKHTKG